MERKNLPKHVRTLATLPVADAPVISCYQTLAAGRLADRNAFDERLRSLRRGLSVPAQHDFDAALAHIEEMIATELLPISKGCNSQFSHMQIAYVILRAVANEMFPENRVSARLW